MTIPITWATRAIQVGGMPLSIARLELPLYCASRLSNKPFKTDCWLDTCAPLSVVPFRIHSVGLNWTTLGIHAMWLGQHCVLGRMPVWFSTSQGTTLRGPFSLLAKFGQSDPSGSPVPILLGLEFLLSHGADVVLPPPPTPGTLTLP
jgi:hypothetical protein